MVQVLVPLPSKAGGSAGFFEGVFVVDRNIIAQFRKQLWHTLGGVLIAILATSLLLYPVIVSLNRDVLRFSHQVLRGNLEMASVLGAAIAKRDSDTGDHNFRIALYAIKLGEAVGLAAPTPLEAALGIIKSDAGTHFDPKLVNLFETIATAMYTSVGLSAESVLRGQLREQAASYFLQASIAAGKS